MEKTQFVPVNCADIQSAEDLLCDVISVVTFEQEPIIVESLKYKNCIMDACNVVGQIGILIKGFHPLVLFA